TIIHPCEAPSAVPARSGGSPVAPTQVRQRAPPPGRAMLETQTCRAPGRPAGPDVSGAGPAPGTRLGVGLASTTNRDVRPPPPRLARGRAAVRAPHATGDPLPMPAGTARESLYLVDAHSLIFQVFHAIRGMSSPSGLPTNAVFGFARDLVFLSTEKRPDYLVIAFDVAGKTFREELYTDYKPNPAPIPDALPAHLPPTH